MEDLNNIVTMYEGVIASCAKTTSNLNEEFLIGGSNSISLETAAAVIVRNLEMMNSSVKESFNTLIRLDKKIEERLCSCIEQADLLIVLLKPIIKHSKEKEKLVLVQ